MGDPAMALGEAELLRIGDYVRGNLRAWLQEVAPTVFTPDPISHGQLLERIARLDERFEHVDERFERMDNRFDDLIHQMDKRFEAVDKRFDDLIHHMDKRFEEQIRSVDKRFEATQATLQQIGKRIGSVQWMVLAGLAAMAAGVTLFATIWS